MLVVRSSYPKGNVASDALVETVLGKDAESGSQAALEVLALLALVIKLQRLGEPTRRREVIAKLLLLAVCDLVD